MKCPVCNYLNLQTYLIEDYKLITCSKCKLVYVGNPPSLKSASKLYLDFDYTNEFEDEQRIRIDSIDSLKWIEIYFSGLRNLLDIGCGRGYFLDEARKRRWKIKGLDYSSKTVEYATKILGLEVVRADVLKYNTRDRYDLITLNQVIEHTINPVAYIKQSAKFLSKNGYLYIATPNIDSHLFKITKIEFPYLIPPFHLTYFNETSLRYMLTHNGFDVKHVNTWSYSVDLAAIIKYIVKRHHNQINKKNISRNIKFAQHLHPIKVVKSFLFDEVFCKTFYKILNMNMNGTIIEILARKV